MAAYLDIAGNCRFQQLEDHYEKVSRWTKWAFLLLLSLWFLLVSCFAAYRYSELTVPKSEKTKTSPGAPHAEAAIETLEEQELKFREYSHFVRRVLSQNFDLKGTLEKDETILKFKVTQKLKSRSESGSSDGTIQQELRELEDDLMNKRFAIAARKALSEFSYLSLLLQSLQSQTAAFFTALDNDGELSPREQKELEILKLRRDRLVDYLRIHGYSKPRKDPGQFIAPILSTMLTRDPVISTDVNPMASKIEQDLSELSGLLALDSLDSPLKHGQVRKELATLEKSLKRTVSLIRENEIASFPSIWKIPYTGGIDVWDSMDEELDSVESAIGESGNNVDAKIKEQAILVSVGILFTFFILIAAKIALNLYRYCSKMEAFYFGRRHLFNFYRHCRKKEGSHQLSSHEVFELLKPEKINFGSGSGAFPTRKAIRILESLSGVVRK